MKSYQDQKSLILSFYDELEAANADSVRKVISQFTNTDFQWYGVYPFNEQKGGDAVAELFWIPFLSAWSNASCINWVSTPYLPKLVLLSFILVQEHMMDYYLSLRTRESPRKLLNW